MFMRVIGFATCSPSSRHQRKRLACRVGNKNEIGSALVDPAPEISALMSASVSATPWFMIQNVAADMYPVMRPSRSDHERRENSDRVAEFIAPFIAMNTGAQVLARADVLGCEERTVRPNGGLLRGVPHISNSGSLTSNPSDA